MSTATADEIERIVKAVMAELRRLTAAPVNNNITATASEKPMPEKTDLVIDAKLVTMADVAGVLTGKRRLLVTQKALVTPAVIDELKRKGVSLVRTNPTNVISKKTNRSVLLVSGRTKQSADSVIRLLEQEDIAVRHEQSECMIVSTDMLAEAIGDGKTLGLLWTSLTAMGLCLANRHKGVRAALATDVAGTSAAVEMIGANVLVLSPTAGTVFERKQILRDFCRSGVRPCPESLASRLS
jgi:ribose 5-phosphate isomerase RpiB